jgi:hypothetical protein
VSAGVIGALVSGAFALAVAVFTYLSTASQQRKQGRRLEEIAEFQARLNDEQSVRNARRDYEYEARKRLYAVYEPLRFQLVDAAGNALRRMSELADARPPDALENSLTKAAGYYLKGTVYYLLAPLALVRLVDKQLTLVDLGLEPAIATEYNYAKTVYRCLADDDVFAAMDPAVAYSPYTEGWRDLRRSDPARYRRQGLPMGRLDNAVDSLLVTGADGVDRLAPFGVFEERFDRTPEGDFNSGLGAARDLFDDFSTESRPVLWRILICQALLYGGYLNLALGGDVSVSQIDRVHALSLFLHRALTDRHRLDIYWDADQAPRRPQEVASFASPLSAALEYCRIRLS